jgi:hypothetical protein
MPVPADWVFSHNDSEGRPVYTIPGAPGSFFYESGGAAPSPEQVEDATREDPVFDPTGLGDNTEFFQENEDDSANLLQWTRESILNRMEVVFANNGFSQDQARAFFFGLWNSQNVSPVIDSILRNAENDRRAFQDGNARFLPDEDRNVGGTQQFGTRYYQETLEGFNDFVSQVWDWYAKKASIDIGEWNSSGAIPRGRGNGRGSASPADIRKQFDITELANGATTLWQGLLLEEPKNARAMAEAYVDAVVAEKGEQRIDFATFITEQARKTARYASIYRNKPESMGESQFLNPFVAAAQQVARPDNVADLAIGGAQFGADASTFGARLRRTEEFTSSSNFINEFEGRLRDLNNLFAGS